MDAPRLNLRLVFPGGAPLSHGKAELMEQIRETGSIRQAAQRMDMSYRRGWLLVDELNRMFTDPVIETQHGGKSGGGAHLTTFGEELLQRFRSMEARAQESLRDDLDWLAAHAALQALDAGSSDG